MSVATNFVETNLQVLQDLSMKYKMFPSLLKFPPYYHHESTPNYKQPTNADEARTTRKMWVFFFNFRLKVQLTFKN